MDRRRVEQGPGPRDEGHASEVAARLEALSADDVERVLKRAIELQVDAEYEPDPVTLDLQALERIADELGISASHLRRAVTEEMLRIRGEEPSLLDRLLVPKRLATRGAVAGDHVTVREALDVWMQRHEGLRKRAESGGSTLWEKNSSIATVLRVKLGMTKGSGALLSAGAVADTVQPLDGGRQLVTVEVDTSNLRRLALGLLAGSAVVAAVGAAVGAGVAGPVDNIAVGAGSLALLGGGVVLGVRMWATRLRQALDRAVDAAANPQLLGDTDPVARGIGRVLDAWRSLRDDFTRRT